MGLVLFVFGTLQFYGPDSAVWRFFDAAKNMDQETWTDAAVAPKNSHEAQEIDAMANALHDQVFANGYTIRLRDSERSPSKVTVTVLLVAPNRRIIRNAPFITVKDRNGWKVDIHETYKIWNSMFRPRPVPQEIN